MGPRPDGRGKVASSVNTQWSSESVNGAAARRPRKVTARGIWQSTPPQRQWGRGQTAAERLGSWGACRGAARVNGAAARRPRKDLVYRL